MTSFSAKRNNWLIHLAALVVVIAGMKTASSLVVPFLLAIFLAIICTPLLYWLKSRKIPGLLCCLGQIKRFPPTSISKKEERRQNK